MSRPHISLDDALHEYYKLKDRYDEVYDKKKMSIMSDETLNIIQKRRKIGKLKSSRRCVICKGVGGTIFTDENRVLKAVCGSVTNPCGLNIEIAKGKIENIGELIRDTYKKIEEIKENIIKYKLDLLFRYITDEQLSQKFGEAKKSLDVYLERYDKLYGKYIDIVINPEIQNELKTLNVELYVYIGQLNQLINEFDATGEIEKIRNMIDIYLSSIIPLTKKIRDTMYVYISIEYDEKTNEHRLIQKKYSIKSMEVDIEHPQVISFTK
jgi:hypothetical protein